MRSMLVVVLVLLASVAQSEIPTVISYQGKVTDASGNPIADDSYTMRFRIYDVLSAGTQLWDSGDCSVAVAGGVFSILLGENPQPAITLDFSQDYWLEVVVGGDTQSPRVKMGSVGYAYMASGLVPGTEVSGYVGTGMMAVIAATNTATGTTAHGLRGVTESTMGSGVYAQATAGSGATEGVHGRSSSTAGTGVCGYATATSGTTYGIYGRSNSTAGTGVYGRAPSTTGMTYGVVGETSTSSGNGVRGVNYATTGYTCAVHGLAMSSAGRAVSGECNGTEGIGVVGWAGATTGGTNGVFGYSASPAGAGVVGQAAATMGGAHGVYGVSAASEGRGVTGVATATSGMHYGVYGQSDSGWGTGVYGDGGLYGVHGVGGGRGVYGESSAVFGVYGKSSTDTGVYGDGGDTGVYGRGTERGVHGYSYTGTGVYGQSFSTGGYGVYGYASATSGYGVYYSGGLAGTGTKSCVVKTSKGPTLMYCQESPENWFEDFGEGRLVNGRCHVELDPVFLETVTIDAANPMKVFVTPDDPTCKGVAVERGLTAFDVIELQSATGDSRFAYRVVAKRQGFEAKRLDVCEAARTDSYLYPELKEKEREEEEARAARREHTEEEYQHPHTALMPVSAVAP